MKMKTREMEGAFVMFSFFHIIVASVCGGTYLKHAVYVIHIDLLSKTFHSMSSNRTRLSLEDVRK